MIGATGSVGRELISLLAEAGVQVCALTRHPKTAGMLAGVETVEGRPHRSGEPRAGVVTGPFGQAAPSLIDERDIAVVALAALTEAGHAGRTYGLTGPEAVTQADQARIIGEAIGVAVRWQDQSRAEARPAVVEVFGEEIADGALDTWEGFVSEPEIVTSTVEEITGKRARSFREWACEHADEFRPVAGVGSA